MRDLPNLTINIISDKINKKAKKYRILLIIAVILSILLPYPLNNILGDSFLYRLILGLLFLTTFILIAIFKHMDKYQVLGKLTFTFNGILINLNQNRQFLESDKLKEIEFKCSGYWEQHAYTTYGTSMRTKNGNENYITIKTLNETYNLELFIHRESVITILIKYFRYYKNLGTTVSAKYI